MWRVIVADLAYFRGKALLLFGATLLGVVLLMALSSLNWYFQTPFDHPSTFALTVCLFLLPWGIISTLAPRSESNERRMRLLGQLPVTWAQISAARLLFGGLISTANVAILLPIALKVQVNGGALPVLFLPALAMLLIAYWAYFLLWREFRTRAGIRRYLYPILLAVIGSFIITFPLQSAWFWRTVTTPAGLAALSTGAILLVWVTHRQFLRRPQYYQEVPMNYWGLPY